MGNYSHAELCRVVELPLPAQPGAAVPSSIWRGPLRPRSGQARATGSELDKRLIILYIQFVLKETLWRT